MDLVEGSARREMLDAYPDGVRRIAEEATEFFGVDSAREAAAVMFDTHMFGDREIYLLAKQLVEDHIDRQGGDDPALIGERLVGVTYPSISVVNEELGVILFSRGEGAEVGENRGGVLVEGISLEEICMGVGEFAINFIPWVEGTFRNLAIYLGYINEKGLVAGEPMPSFEEALKSWGIERTDWDMSRGAFLTQ